LSVFTFPKSLYFAPFLPPLADLPFPHLPAQNIYLPFFFSCVGRGQDIFLGPLRPNVSFRPVEVGLPPLCTFYEARSNSSAPLIQDRSDSFLETHPRIIEDAHVFSIFLSPPFFNKPFFGSSTPWTFLVVSSIHLFFCCSLWGMERRSTSFFPLSVAALCQQ